MKKIFILLILVCGLGIQAQCQSKKYCLLYFYRDPIGIQTCTIDSGQTCVANSGLVGEEKMSDPYGYGCIANILYSNSPIIGLNKFMKDTNYKWKLENFNTNTVTLSGYSKSVMTMITIFVLSKEVK